MMVVSLPGARLDDLLIILTEDMGLPKTGTHMPFEQALVGPRFAACGARLQKPLQLQIGQLSSWRATGPPVGHQAHQEEEDAPSV